MPNGKTEAPERTAQLLRTLIIVQLALADVGQANIRGIVGGSMNDVNDIVKLVKKKRGASE